MLVISSHSSPTPPPFFGGDQHWVICLEDMFCFKTVFLLWNNRKYLFEGKVIHSFCSHKSLIEAN